MSETELDFQKRVNVILERKLEAVSHELELAKKGNPWISIKERDEALGQIDLLQTDLACAYDALRRIAKDGNEDFDGDDMAWLAESIITRNTSPHKWLRQKLRQERKMCAGRIHEVMKLHREKMVDAITTDNDPPFIDAVDCSYIEQEIKEWERE